MHLNCRMEAELSLPRPYELTPTSWVLHAFKPVYTMRCPSFRQLLLSRLAISSRQMSRREAISSTVDRRQLRSLMGQLLANLLVHPTCCDRAIAVAFSSHLIKFRSLFAGSSEKRCRNIAQ